MGLLDVSVCHNSASKVLATSNILMLGIREYIGEKLALMQSGRDEAVTLLILDTERAIIIFIFLILMWLHLQGC